MKIIFSFLEIKVELSTSEAMAQQFMAAGALNALALPALNGSPNNQSTGEGGHTNLFPYMPPGINANTLYSGMGLPAPLIQSGVVPGELH